MPRRHSAAAGRPHSAPRL